MVLALVAGACGRRGPGGTLPTAGRREQQLLLQQASREMSCPAPALSIMLLTRDVWQVQGCGLLRDFRLEGTGRRARWTPIEPMPVRASREMACPVSAMSFGAPLPTVRDATGCGRSARYVLVCTASGCLWGMSAHAGAWAGEVQSAPALLPPPSGGSSAPSGGPTSSGADTISIPPPPVEGSVEATLRALLDTRRDAVRGCVGASPVPVQVVVAPDGAVHVTFEPPHATAAARCAPLLEGLRVPAGAAGTWSHAL